MSGVVVPCSQKHAESRTSSIHAECMTVRDEMVIETHGDHERTEDTAQLLAALLDIGKLPQFADEVEERGLAWHAICRCEDDLLAFERRNRWCGSTDGWYIVVGHADTPEGCSRIDMVPEYTGWAPVQAWLEHDGTPITVESGYGVHVWDRELFDFETQCDVFVRAAFADDSAMTLNRAFRWSQQDEAWLSRRQ